MPGPWITTGDALQALADVLHQSVNDLIGTEWERKAAVANTAAAGDITQILLGRGYTQTQVDAWDYRATYNRDQATFWALVRGGGLSDYTDLHAKKLDRREELETLTLVVAGVPVQPGQDAPPGYGAVGAGRLSEEDYRITSETEF